MFFLLILKKDLFMHPSSFGPRLHEEIKKALYGDVEGTVDTRYGFIIAVTKVMEIPLGQVQEGGLVKFTVTYQAIIFRPFRNQVLDAVVTTVDNMGVRCAAGPLTIFIHREVPTTSISS
jgi:DNA-directed RNA polymerase II subunit RPB7